MARTRTRRPPSKRPTASKKRPSPPSQTKRNKPATPTALAPHKGDIQGVALILIAVLLALGVWLHNGGKVGLAAELALRGLFGYGAYAVPMLVAGAGASLFRRSVAPRGEPVASRAAIGLVAVLLGGLGLVDLLRGAPTATSSTAVLQNSGGWVGAVIGTPLARLLSTWGAGVGFACLLFLGLLISTRTSVASVMRGLGAVARMIRSAVTPPPRPAGDAAAAGSAADGASGKGAAKADGASGAGGAGNDNGKGARGRASATPAAAGEAAATAMDDPAGALEEPRRSRRGRKAAAAAATPPSDEFEGETVEVNRAAPPP
ncbi:MAG TPA: DNA translocase FtsK 4TM domain-containing protein, partial [Actinomycetota bacterium]